MGWRAASLAHASASAGLVDRSLQLDDRLEPHRRSLVDPGHCLVGQTHQVIAGWLRIGLGY